MKSSLDSKLQRPSTKRKIIAVPPEIHTALAALARANGRTIIGQLRVLLTLK